MTHRIRASLWFDNNLGEALDFYKSVFPDFEVLEKSFMPESEMTTADTMMAATFRVNGFEFMAINGGPLFKFRVAVSFAFDVDTQEEFDYYWSRLTEGGEESQCGWLKDPFGLSWQVVPKIVFELLGDPDPARASRAMNAMLTMQRIDIAEMLAAADRTD